jgi:hypothetical protein
MTGTFDDATLNRRAAKLSALLAAADDRPPSAVFPAERIARAARRGVLVRRVRIAAAAALLLAGLGVPPVRAWIVGSVRTIWTRVIGPRQPAPRPVPAPAPLPATTLGTVTVGASSGFTLRVATRQAAGDLTILVTDGASVSAAVEGRSDAAELTVFPDGIRIENERATFAGYELRVPLAVSRLVVQVGRESPRVLFPTRVGERWIVSLRAH